MPTRKAPGKIDRETGARSKIRIADLESVFRKLAAEWLPFRDVVQRLATDHGCVVSHVSVKRFIDEGTEERRAAARSVASRSVPLVTGGLVKAGDHRMPGRGTRTTLSVSTAKQPTS